jgi:intracellular septation protein
MKQILDFIPLIIFFALYKMYDIYVATGALIVATAIQLVVTFALYKKSGKNATGHFHYGGGLRWYDHLPA